MCRTVVTWVFVVFAVIPGLSQEVRVSSHFHADSLRIGDVVPYSLTARYPSNLNLVFPDSTGRYFPFEYSHRKYFATKTNEGVSYDSVVYYLTTFEVDSVQSLALPVFVIHDSDCTRIESELQYIRLQSLVAHVPDSVDVKALPLKVTVAYEPVDKEFNYILAGGIIFILAVLTVAGWLIFGKRIRRFFAVRRLTREYTGFNRRFGESLHQVAQQSSAQAVEHSVALWKGYLELLENKPYTKLTSKETLRIIQDDRIRISLQDIDRMVYANAGADIQPLEELRMYADQAFQKKMKEVAHG